MKLFNIPRFSRRAILGILGVVTIVVVVAAVLPELLTYRRPVRKLDTLTSPIAVAGWADDGLRLADARILQLPGFRKLPKTSVALSEVGKRGVEIAADGRVFGLVSVHHWCGNDPVREHIARVNVADMLMYLQEGEWSQPPSTDALQYLCPVPSGTFSEWGWDSSEFAWFTHWNPRLNFDNP